jgi:hypothetical protein
MAISFLRGQIIVLKTSRRVIFDLDISMRFVLKIGLPYADG